MPRREVYPGFVVGQPGAREKIVLEEQDACMVQDRRVGSAWPPVKALLVPLYFPSVSVMSRPQCERGHDCKAVGY